MNSFWNNNQGYNPNIYPYPQNTFNTMPKYEIIKVNGEAGAKSFRMAPNSSALLLDETAPIIWLVQTDGAGYSTAIAYDITLHKDVPPININELAARVSQLEETINAKSNFRANKQPKKQSNESTPTPES